MKSAHVSISKARNQLSDSVSKLNHIEKRVEKSRKELESVEELIIRLRDAHKMIAETLNELDSTFITPRSR